ncbi:hypothetical protein BGW80DRAFT_1468016 [Lactifluus volemus]|nr:hypothetical protein BGW80DRAFT_1468016 [Lactifluus volemus]
MSDRGAKYLDQDPSPERTVELRLFKETWVCVPGATEMDRLLQELQPILVVKPPVPPSDLAFNLWARELASDLCPLYRAYFLTKTDIFLRRGYNSLANMPSLRTTATSSDRWQETTLSALATTSPSHLSSHLYTWALPRHPPSIVTPSIMSSLTAASTLTIVPLPLTASPHNTSSLQKGEAGVSHNSYSSHNKASGPSHPALTPLE